MLWLDHFLFAGGLPTLSVLAWWGLDALRGHWQFRHSFTRDVTQSAPGPAPATELMIDRLSRLGFERLGVTRSGRPILGERVTAWVLVDPGRTSIAEITLLAGQRNAICAFSSILGDGTILSTSHGYGFDVRKRELVAQPVPTGPEDAWRRHQESLDELRPDTACPCVCTAWPT